MAAAGRRRPAGAAGSPCMRRRSRRRRPVAPSAEGDTGGKRERRMRLSERARRALYWVAILTEAGTVLGANSDRGGLCIGRTLYWVPILTEAGLYWVPILTEAGAVLGANSDRGGQSGRWFVWATGQVPQRGA
eukprot:365002-Chlamydomonas_euryale.AAC.3